MTGRKSIEEIESCFADIDECLSQPCPQDEPCFDRVNGFKCGSQHADKQPKTSRKDPL